MHNLKTQNLNPKPKQHPKTKP